MEIESMGKGRVPGSMPDEREVTKGDEAARQPQRGLAQLGHVPIAESGAAPDPARL
jgi:hypothetical protein